MPSQRPTYLSCEILENPGPAQDRYFVPVSLLEQYICALYLWKKHANKRSWPPSPGFVDLFLLFFSSLASGGGESRSCIRRLPPAVEDGIGELELWEDVPVLAAWDPVRLLKSAFHWDLSIV